MLSYELVIHITSNKINGFWVKINAIVVFAPITNATEKDIKELSVKLCGHDIAKKMLYKS